ncbi:hypothetical protein TrST_g6238 [Triparma strigata]|uniref:Uncharacterized protein n=1 Tax=Triparma strigata TaxID=1606541 RepID=A0A9W7BJC2_9STRA|nr:hypothetical protein TrST_g6238 [Triparma strigata]
MEDGHGHSDFDPDYSSPRRRIIDPNSQPRTSVSPTSAAAATTTDQLANDPRDQDQEHASPSASAKMNRRPSFREETRALVYRNQDKPGQGDSGSDLGDSESDLDCEVMGFVPMKFDRGDDFELLLEAREHKHDMFEQQRGLVKTMKNDELVWRRFLASLASKVAFHTSLTLLPTTGKYMRTYGSVTEYPTGVMFRLPEDIADEGQRFDEKKPPTTYCWPSGYAAKTEFNLDSWGTLFNGRDEHLVSIEELRKQNRTFEDALSKGLPVTLHNRSAAAVMTSVPLNEVYVQIGGSDGDASHDSLRHGIGEPIGLFTRGRTFFHFVALLRARMRFPDPPSLPLYYIDHEHGVRAINGRLYFELLKSLANDVEPWKPQRDSETNMLLFDELTSEHLTLSECAALAGGYGVDNSSVASMFSSLKPEKARSIAIEALLSSVRASNSRAAEQILTQYYLSGYDLALDTASLRRRCRDRGTLVVLGATEIIKNLQTGTSQSKMMDAASSLEEWCKDGAKKGMSFRLQSWRQLRKSAKEGGSAPTSTKASSSRMAAFLSHEAIQKRHKFAVSLQRAAREVGVKESLLKLDVIVNKMNKPCLRLEILQYILSLESKYSLKMVQNALGMAIRLVAD